MSKISDLAANFKTTSAEQANDIEITSSYSSHLALDGLQHYFGTDRVVGRDWVSGNADQGKLPHHQPVERYAGETSTKDFRDPVIGKQEGEIYRPAGRNGSGTWLDGRDAGRVETGEKTNDRARESAVDRLRAITDRARQTTSRLCEGLQRISENVRDYFSREPGATAVGKVLRQEIAQNRQLGDREMSL